jgi:hypothetical protein
MIISYFLINSFGGEQKEPPPKTISTGYKKLENILNFHTIPISDSILEFQFNLIKTYEFKNIYLIQGEDTLSN